MVDKQGVYDRFVNGELTITVGDDQYKQWREFKPLDEVQTEYKFIKNALEKQIPKKVLPDDQYLEGICPNCGVHFLDRLTNYCGNCGQALDWSNKQV